MKPAYLTILRDTLILLPRLLFAFLQIAWKQFFENPSPRLRQLTSADWLGQRLGLDPEQIERATIEEVHNGTSTRSRLHIHYSKDSAVEPGPASFFIKSSPPDFSSSLFGLLFGLGGNEVSFYRHLRSEIPVKSPRVLSSEGNSRDFAMLLEDLTEQDCRFRTLNEKCSFDEAVAIVTALGKLHAEFWQSPRFDADLAWVNRFETNRDARLLNLVRHVSVPIACKKFAEVLPAGIHEIIPYLMKNYLRLEAQWAQEPRTLLHGDAHLGNMYFQGNEVGFLDWQVVQLGQGMRDVSYLLINSMETEMRLQHQEGLIRRYLEVLKDREISLDFDTAWRQYRLQSVYAWIAGVVTAPSNFQEDSVVIAGLTRSCEAVLDLDAVELIRQM